MLRAIRRLRWSSCCIAEKVALQRIQETREQRVKARQAITSGTPLKAEEDCERRTSYVERVRPEKLSPGAEAIQSDLVDYVDAVFLLTGTSAARTVPHVLIDDTG